MRGLCSLAGIVYHEQRRREGRSGDSAGFEGHTWCRDKERKGKAEARCCAAGCGTLSTRLVESGKRGEREVKTDGDQATKPERSVEGGERIGFAERQINEARAWRSDRTVLTSFRLKPYSSPLSSLRTHRLLYSPRACPHRFPSSRPPSTPPYLPSSGPCRRTPFSPSSCMLPSRPCRRGGKRH